MSSLRYLVYHLLSNLSKTTVYNCLNEVGPMPRECNIDARGKFLRLLGGSISLSMAIIALGLLYFGFVPTNWFTVTSIIGMFGGGALGIYEGRSGWCIARAMGIWTPI